jgi:glycosyltransferase involved in cell wall biosynthesis
VAVAELAPAWWMLPPSAFVERALSIVEVLSDRDAVVDHSASWATLVRRTACPFPVLGAKPLAAPRAEEPGRRGLPGEHLLPAVDPERFEVGRGAGGYVVGDLRPAERRELGDRALVRPAHDGGRPERAALLADAVAFVAPQDATGGWAAVEALACGTPVVARAGTAAAEVVSHGVTGIVVDHGDPLADAVAAAGALDRWACRHSACETFSTQRRARDLVAALAAVLRAVPEAGVAARPSPEQDETGPATGERHQGPRLTGPARRRSALAATG